MNIPSTARVLCPFFRRSRSERNDGAAVICEGVETGMESGVLFKCREDRDGWMRTKCEAWSYGDCPVAKMLEGRYDD